ncbi:MAG: phage tail sheath subtilisin-like domain-containing protein [Ardenticatenaceae bacterium]|nr:phage tail sheath subtilisin-like domain-containing protein [Anaerolineales bacterium]MCB9005895.1 phage tail sheath subtilisin-like domain-containing protein [Ardenticatenaceae bacterium]
MPEMILPGTYIEVRAEKLIVPGPIAIGNVGIVGTARRGRLADPNDPETVYTPANIGEARDIFGDADAFNNPITEDHELTLIRALELAFANGAQRVYAARVAKKGTASAIYELAAGSGKLQLTAVAPGDGYNQATITTGPIITVDSVDTLDMGISVSNTSETWRSVPANVADFVKVINGDHPDYNYRAKASTGGKSNLFTAADNGATGKVTAEQKIEPPDGKPTTAGTNGAEAGSSDYETGLNALAMKNVHIVVLAGQTAADVGDKLVTHVTNASSDLMRRERIGVIGSDPSNTVASLNALAQDDGRIVFVGPGLKVNDTASDTEVTLSGAYTAAAVAGRISSLDPHASPTNKTIVARNLEKDFNGTELEQLLLNRVMVLEDRNGALRIVQGLTSSTNTAWRQVTTRRIVDFAKFGVRSASNPFIGKLNNERVRQALKGSINGFLADMVDREMLISYELEVTATREQEIRGIAQVTMVVRPTFSIDYIRVVMYLE